MYFKIIAISLSLSPQHQLVKKSTPWIGVSCRLQIFGVSCLLVSSIASLPWCVWMNSMERPGGENTRGNPSQLMSLFITFFRFIDIFIFAERQFSSRPFAIVNEIHRIAETTNFSTEQAAHVLEQRRVANKWALNRLCKELRKWNEKEISPPQRKIKTLSLLVQNTKHMSYCLEQVSVEGEGTNRFNRFIDIKAPVIAV